MESKIFLDANIIIDLISSKRLNHTLALQTIQKIIQKDCQIYISENILTIVYYIVKDKQSVLKFFKEALKDWYVVPFGKDVLNSAIDFSIVNNTDLEDTLQCFCAKENRCDIFLTSDKKFIDCGIKILDYNEFLGLK